MTESVDLSPVRFAALVAPAVDRAFIAGMRAGGSRGRDLVMSHGGRPAGTLIDLRNPLAAGRPVTREGLAAVYRYRPADQLAEDIDRAVDGGMLVETPAGALIATAAGLGFLEELFALHADVLSERWEPHRDRVERLNATLERLLPEAAGTAGAAWQVQAPPYEDAGTPAPVLLLNRLSTLRYHRADAHAAAWQAAGLSAPEIVAMPPGPARDAIEQDTNARAAAPYRILTAEQRLDLLADLAALP